MANRRKEHNVEKYESIFIRSAVVAPKSAKSILRKFELIAVQGRRLGANRKPICNFLLVINSNYGRISYRFPDIDAFNSKIACFPHPPLFHAF